MMLPILVDDEGGDSELLGLVDLLVHDHAILRRVSDVDVAGLPEPWQIRSQHYGSLEPPTKLLAVGGE